MHALSALVLFASASAVARADECPIRVLSLSFEGKGTADLTYRYRVVLEAASGNAPRDLDLQIQSSNGRTPLSARAAHLQFYQDEGAYDDVVVFDRPSQDVSGIAVGDTVSGDVTTPCTSPTAHIGDPVDGLAGWDIPTVIATLGDSKKVSTHVSQIDLLTGRSRDGNFKTKAALNYPLIAQSMDVSGETVVRVTLGPAGQLEDARIDTSSGSKVLDDSAIDAAEKSAYTGSTLDGIPIVQVYNIVYEFRLDNEPAPPDMSDLIKLYCPAVLGHPFVNASLNSGTAFWYELHLTTAERKFDSISVEMVDSSSHVNDLLWNVLLRGYGDTMGIGRDPSLDHSSLSGALFWPSAALTWGQVQAVTEHAKKSSTCKPYPVDVSNKVDSDSLIAVTQTDRPWLTAPVVETVLPARFAVVSWPKYAPAVESSRPVAIRVSVHVTQSGEPLVGVVHGVSAAPEFSAAALNAAMTSTYIVPRTADGAVITQTFDIEYLYVPSSSTAGNPVGLVSLDRSDGIRQRPPHD
jgi:TonB family protein